MSYGGRAGCFERDEGGGLAEFVEGDQRCPSSYEELLRVSAAQGVLTV